MFGLAVHEIVRKRVRGLVLNLNNLGNRPV